VIRKVYTLTTLKVVKAEAYPCDVATAVRRSTDTEGGVHLAGHAFGTVCQSELDCAAAQVCLKLMDGPQGLGIHIHINVADELAIAAGFDLCIL
jgi:hypothetical protein